MGALHRSHRLLACSILVAAAACSGDDDTSPAATAPTVDEGTCRRLAEAAVAPAQDFLDQFTDMTPDELAAMNPPPDVRASRPTSRSTPATRWPPDATRKRSRRSSSIRCPRFEGRARWGRPWLRSCAAT